MDSCVVFAASLSVDANRAKGVHPSGNAVKCPFREYELPDMGCTHCAKEDYPKCMEQCVSGAIP